MAQDNTTTVLPARFRIWVSISDMDETPILDYVPVAHLTMNFGLNGVGTATFILATGMDANTQELADIHTVADQIDSQVLVSCYMIADGHYKEDTPWPQTPIRIWDGVSSGINFTVNRQTLSLQLGSVHWLSRLDMASVAGGNILKGSCDSFTSTFGIQTLNGGGALATQSALTLIPGAPTGDTDFWEDIVKAMILGLADEKNDKVKPGTQNWVDTFRLLNSVCPGRVQTDIDIEVGNKEATDIINNRFNDTKYINKGVLQGDFTTVFGQAGIAGAYLDTVAQIVGGRIGSSTALEKMYACAQMFMYNIIYNVESATCAPHVPVLKSDRLWRTINADEYTLIRGSSFTPPEISGVGVYGQEYTNTFDRGQKGGPPRPDQRFIIGAFKASARGKLLMLDAPPYLTPRIKSGSNANTLKAPQSSIGKPAKTKTDPGIDEAVDDAINRVGCAYAQLKYYDSVFSLRTAIVSGKLRFDIAPGSMVRVKNALLKLPQFNATELYATIAGVSVIIDAQDGHAITNLSLSHIRSVKEDDFAPTAHPFFSKKPWIGCPLVKVFDSDLTPEQDSSNA